MQAAKERRNIMEQAPCIHPGCERLADPEREPLEVCKEHWDEMQASSDVEAWKAALAVLKSWVQTTEAIALDKLTQIMEHALAEAEWEADLAQDELERAEKAALL